MGAKPTLRNKKEDTAKKTLKIKNCSIVSGSDQGFLIIPFPILFPTPCKKFSGEQEIWVIAARIEFRWMHLGFSITSHKFNKIRQSAIDEELIVWSSGFKL